MDTNQILKAKDTLSNFQGAPFRPGQGGAIQRIVESDKKVVVVCAPTGAGKSLIGMVAGQANDKHRFAYLCSTKQLQRQLVQDFPEAKHMMGRANFMCNQDPENRTADLCIHTQATPCNLKSVCMYELHKENVLNHPAQVLNYHYFVTESNYVGRFTDYPIIICDEADQIESILTGFVELRISKFQLDMLKISPPRYKTSTAARGLDSWRQWAAGEVKDKVAHRVRELSIHLSGLKPGGQFTQFDEIAIREYKQLSALNSKLDIFTMHMDDTWIFQEQKQQGDHITAWMFQPTWLIPELSHQYLFRHGEKFVLMSATFPPVQILAQMLGLNAGDIDIIELPSSFPESNRRVYLRPVGDMSYKTFSAGVSQILPEITRLLAEHPDEKGVIHTTSWKLNKLVMALGDPRLMTHNSHDKDAQLKKFSESDNSVFVSPSSTRGLDLPDEACRFIIIAKAPFQSLADKLVSSRVYGSGLGKYWYRAICAQDLVQASGRGVRHREDYCTTYLLDKQTERLVVDNQALFPRYWMKAVDYA